MYPEKASVSIGAPLAKGRIVQDPGTGSLQQRIFSVQYLNAIVAWIGEVEVAQAKSISFCLSEWSYILVASVPEQWATLWPRIVTHHRWRSGSPRTNLSPLDNFPDNSAS